MDQPDRLLIAELEDRVEQVFVGVEQLHESFDDGKAKRDLLESIFRDVHSLKATAAANGFDSLSHVAHEFEDLLHALRVGRAEMNDQVLQTFDEAADALFKCLEPRGAVEGDFDRLFERLKQLSGASAAAQRKPADVLLNSLQAEPRSSLSEGERHRLREALSEGSTLFLISTQFDIAEFDALFQRLKESLNQKGEVISTAPRVEDRNDRRTIDFRILYTRDSDLSELQQDLSSFAGTSVSEIISATTETTPTQSDITQQADSNSKTSKAKKSNYIRINLADLDHLISSMHTLYRQTTNCLDEVLAAADRSKLEPKLQTVNKSFLSLAAELVDLRMVSIDRVLYRALRAGRAVARAAGKDVDFVVRGEGVMLDKSLVEAIADPLVHLVRNAVDHGVETTAERLERGKEQRAQIVIEATTVQGQTRITVSDDGRGIDIDRISQTAWRLGIVPDRSPVSISQSLRLIFRPGFSTTKEVSSSSGRGVGLDAVEDEIEQVGGGIRVSSSPGEGSSFEIRLPVTFGLLDVIAVYVGGRKYLVDSTYVVGLRPFVSADVRVTGDTRQVQMDQESFGLRTLHDLLAQPPVQLDNDSTRTLLICEPGSGQSSELDLVALLVDEAEEPQTVLVRNLGSRGARWFGVAGASELRDGSVALLLDLPRLLRA